MNVVPTPNLDPGNSLVKDILKGVPIVFAVSVD